MSATQILLRRQRRTTAGAPRRSFWWTWSHGRTAKRGEPWRGGGTYMRSPHQLSWRRRNASSLVWQRRLASSLPARLSTHETFWSHCTQCICRLRYSSVIPPGTISRLLRSHTVAPELSGRKRYHLED